MVRLISPKNAYISREERETGEFHLKAMGDEGLILMVCGATFDEGEVESAPLTELDVGDGLCPVCFGPITSGVGEPLGEKGLFTLPISGLRFQGSEEFHVKFLGDGGHDVMACGLAGPSSDELETPLAQIPASQLCSGCFGPFQLEDGSASDSVDESHFVNDELENFDEIIDKFLETGEAKAISVKGAFHEDTSPKSSAEAISTIVENREPAKDKVVKSTNAKYAIAGAILLALFGGTYLYFGGIQTAEELMQSGPSEQEVAVDADPGDKEQREREKGLLPTAEEEVPSELIGNEEQLRVAASSNDNLTPTLDEKESKREKSPEIAKRAEQRPPKETPAPVKTKEVKKEPVSSKPSSSQAVPTPKEGQEDKLTQSNLAAPANAGERVSETKKTESSEKAEEANVMESPKIPPAAATPPPEDGEISFADLRLEECVANALAASAEGEISYEALLALESLDCSGLGITSVSGIEYFAGLRLIDLSDNSITDVTPLLALPKLERLNLSGNKELAKLPESGFPASVSVDLSGTPAGG